MAAGPEIWVHTTIVRGSASRTMEKGGGWRKARHKVCVEICAKVVDRDFKRHVVYLPHRKQLAMAGAPTPAGRNTARGRLHQDEHSREELALDLNEIARAGARRMLAEALEAEGADYLDAAKGQRDYRGRALVGRNSYARERKVLLGAGAVEVRAPRVNDRRVDRRQREDGYYGCR